MKKLLTVGAVCAAAIMPAHAGVFDSGDLTLSGFGTLGMAKSNTDQVRFVRYNQLEGVGEDARIGLDSNLGLQMNYKANDWLSGTVQILTRKGPTPGFTTDLTWAFLKARINDDLSVRVGRIVLPTFLISDYQNVGYANSMMRPPIEVYSQAPVESTDGIDLSYQRTVGDLSVTLQPFVGVSRGKLFVGMSNSTYRAPNYGFVVTAEYAPFLFRFSHVKVKVNSNDIAPLNNLSAVLARAGFRDLASDLILSDKKIDITAIGTTMDWRNIVMQAEYGQRRPKDPTHIPPTNYWYTMLGYRIGTVLPYYAHANYTSGTPTARVPANFPRGGPLGGAIRGLLGPNDQSSDLIGVRWDFAKSVALKVQIDRVKPKYKTGLLLGPVTGYTRPVTVVGATLDFVF
ncbi:MAG: hypothetical protein V4754_05320 [Pseudomonadota bacterium]